ncbi:hypothetical protein PtA15_2A649 [Puccinia triticina]|uniref:Uncharacterized protein n=1 Tax=Puccinia triticina TaxID=208348 RepID=A0ABY7CHR0_9BASI|nr:uncharacterized protein PtA15_2A649 [Puccinia triticina]WAQ82332.1 hypothetical protein PtA15_2A649 [Puccinia triticina]
MPNQPLSSHSPSRLPGGDAMQGLLKRFPLPIFLRKIPHVQIPVNCQKPVLR